MFIIKRLKNAIVEYNDSFKCYMLYEKTGKNSYGGIAEVKLEDGLITIGDYVVAKGSADFNLIKMNKGLVSISDNRLMFVGSITLYKE